MKLVIEILLSIFLHPIALVLTWINLAGRADLTTAEKIIWALVSVLWGVGPILYVLVGRGEFW